MEQSAAFLGSGTGSPSAPSPTGVPAAGLTSDATEEGEPRRRAFGTKDLLAVLKEDLETYEGERSSAGQVQALTTLRAPTTVLIVLG